MVAAYTCADIAVLCPACGGRAATVRDLGLSRHQPRACHGHKSAGRQQCEQPFPIRTCFHSVYPFLEPKCARTGGSQSRSPVQESGSLSVYTLTQQYRPLSK